VIVNRTLRQFAKDPGFTLAAVLTLALGIAANATIFSLVYAALLRPLPYKQADQLMVLWANIPGKGIAADWTSWPTIQDWRKQSKSFEDVAAELRIDSATLTNRNEPEQIKVGRVSANLFPLLGIRPVIGRTYTSEEETRREALVVISSQFWRTRFASSPSVIGKQIEVDHKKATVVGVMPQAFAFPSADRQLWLPLSFVPQWSAFLSARQSDGFRAIARLKPGVSLKQAQSEMKVIAERLGKQYPDTDAGKGIVLVPVAKQLTDPQIRAALWTLFGAVVLVLLIGCSNVASLLLARGTIRGRELAIRAALGASRSNLIRQLMGESLVLAAVSGLSGLGITILLRQVLPVIVPSDLAVYARAELSAPVLAFALILSMATAMFFGFVPAWQLSFAEPQSGLKGGSRTEIGQRSRGRMRSVLIVGEFALAVILLSGTGLLIHSFLLLQKENLGFTPANLLLATINLPRNDPRQVGSTNVFLQDVLAQVKSLPGVVDVAATGGSLFSDYTPNTDVITEEATHISHHVQTAPSTAGVVTETFFQTMRIPLLRGRSFSPFDDSNHPSVAVINKNMADQFWTGQNAIGKRFRYGSPGAIEPEWLTVIGLVGDVNPYGPGSKVISTFYRPYRQTSGPSSIDIVLRCESANCASVSNQFREIVRSANRQIPQFAVQSANDVLAQMSAPRRFQIWLLGIFSGAALCLATVGIYGLLSYLVSQRTQEIGLRMALGATARDILQLVFASGIKLAALGIVIGLGASSLLMRLLQHLLFGVSPNDPITALLVTVVLLGAAFGASYFPARTATRLDPFAAIRNE
jgi:predicted permease